MQDSQHDDPSRDARQLPSGVTLSRGTGEPALSSEPCNNASGELLLHIGEMVDEGLAPQLMGRSVRTPGEVTDDKLLVVCPSCFL